jgi:DNA transposition AAA+ family ATPase
MVRLPEAGPPGARIISTPQLQMARHVVTDITAHQAVGVIHGNAGLGKTFAVRACTQAMAAGTGRREAPTVCPVSFTPQPTLRQIVDGLHLALTGTSSQGSSSRFNITRALITELARTPRLVVVDEAQRLTGHGIELLRYLHDDENTRFGLLYVGGDGCWQVLSREPMLASRIWRRLAITPLDRAVVPEALRGYHPMYAEADDDLLHYIDDRLAHGIWRNWALFSSTAHLLAQRAQRSHVDEEIVTNAFALHSGGPVGV